MRQTFVIVILTCINWMSVYAQDITIELYQNIQMRDGINLSANIYFPDTTEKSYPEECILPKRGTSLLR